VPSQTMSDLDIPVSLEPISQLKIGIPKGFDSAKLRDETVFFQAI